MARNTEKSIQVIAMFLAMGMALWGNKTQAQQVSEEYSWFPDILRETEAAYLEAPYLPDFSYAGYRWSEEPLPEVEGMVFDVTDFGAVPDDRQDDTEAIQQALEDAHAAEASPVVVRFPAGQFIVRQILFIERDSLVIRGSGAERTTLHVSQPLSEMDVPTGFENRLPDGTTPFSLWGGVLWGRAETSRDPWPEKRRIGRARSGRRGQHTFEMEEVPVDLRPGQTILIEWYNREGRNGSLLQHVFCTTDLTFGRQVVEGNKGPLGKQSVTVTAVQGKTVTVKEPLLHDLRKRWKPELYVVDFLREIGVEHLRIKFPYAEYKGHHDEEGYNGIYFNGVEHSWIRDVRIKHVDSGILLRDSKNVTVDKIGMRGRFSHYTVGVYGSGLLVKNFDLQARARHNPAFVGYSNRSVYTGGIAHRPRLDQHNAKNQQNLFDNFTARYNGPDDRYFRNGRDGLFSHGGGDEWRPNAGAFNTFWNLNVQFEGATEPVDLGGPNGAPQDAPHARLVGLRGNVPVSFDYGPEAYVEGTNWPNLEVPSLFEYQLGRRLSGRKRPRLAITHPLNRASINEEDRHVLLEASLSNGDERVSKVAFFVDGSKVGVDSTGTDGWAAVWQDPSPGRYAIKAVATTRTGDQIPSMGNTCTGEDLTLRVGDRSASVEEGKSLPKPRLRGNRPNPFSTTTAIRYWLPERKHVRLAVFDALGRRMAILMDEKQEGGARNARFNAKGLSNGVYFYRLQAGRSVQTKAAVLVR